MHQIDVNGLVVDVVRKDIKHLHLAVYPPNGRVRVAAPLRVDDEAVRLAVIAKLAWIKRQQAKFEEQERQTEREYVSGESHYFQGTRYRLNVVPREGAGQVVIRNKSMIDFYVRPQSTAAQRERVMLAWYRAFLKATIPLIITKWEKVMGIKVQDWGVKQMKTRWGTCNVAAGRIWVNLELAKKPLRCLEYIIVHEMVHLLERQHNDRFRALMNQFLPQWQIIREELNREPLAHEDWSY
ncbi:MAG: M48 family metallopeptidase [Anaerolineales bacterium]|nr:M48 family metallopeptidase [Anaerolineales bacterium]